MRRKNQTAVLIIDLINDFDFEDGTKLLKKTSKVVKNISALKKKAKARKYPIIYVNDNFGRWRSDFKKHLEHCLEEDSPGCHVVAVIKPDADDFYVLKPKNSAFWDTPLATLLDHLSVKKLIITGITSHICILFTAHDAYLRGLEIVVPRDCIAAANDEDHRYALNHIKNVLKGDVRSWEKNLRN